MERHQPLVRSREAAMTESRRFRDSADFPKQEAEASLRRSISVPKASGAWLEGNRSVVESQRLKIEAMLSKSTNDCVHSIHEDRKCWWLEEIDTHRSEESKQSKVSFSTVVDHRLISDAEWSSECLSDSDGAALDLYNDSDDHNSSSSSSDDESKESRREHGRCRSPTLPDTIRCSEFPPSLKLRGATSLPSSYCITELEGRTPRYTPPAGPVPDAAPQLWSHDAAAVAAKRIACN
jgi:hypothetical protein